MIRMFLLVFSANAIAGYELEAKVSELSYRLGRNYSFPVTLYQAGLSHVDYFRYSILVGQTNSSVNQSSGPSISAKINNFWVFSFSKKFNLSNRFSASLGINYSEYKETVGEFTGPDTDWGYSYGFLYRLNMNHSIKIEQTQYYRKRHDTLGIENTKGLGISFISLMN